MSQSTRAHRLTRKAYITGGQKLQLPVLCGIFKANLEDGKDIGDVNVLAEVAEKSGMMTKEEASCSTIKSISSILDLLIGCTFLGIGWARAGNK